MKETAVYSVNTFPFALVLLCYVSLLRPLLMLPYLWWLLFKMCSQTKIGTKNSVGIHVGWWTLYSFTLFLTKSKIKLEGQMMKKKQNEKLWNSFIIHCCCYKVKMMILYIHFVQLKRRLQMPMVDFIYFISQSCHFSLFLFFHIEKRFFFCLKRNEKSKIENTFWSLIVFYIPKNQVFDEDLLWCNRFSEFLIDFLFFNFSMPLATIHRIVDFYVTWTW